MNLLLNKAAAALRGAVLAGVSLTLVFAAAGCAEQKTIAGLIDAVGIAAVAYANAKGDAEDAGKITDAYQAAASIANNWTPGTPALDVIQAVYAFQSTILPLLDLDAQDTAETTALTSGVVAVLELLPGGTASMPAPEFQLRAAITPVTTVKNAKQFNALWQAALTLHPIEGSVR